MKKIMFMILTLTMTGLLAACGGAPGNSTAEPSAEISATAEITSGQVIGEETPATEPAIVETPATEPQNPLVESNAQEIVEKLGISFHLPDAAKNVRYFILNGGNAQTAQARFTLDGVEYDYRIRPASEFMDISGAYYDWTSTETGEVGYCTAKVQYNEDKEGICLWYDVVPGLMYSVSMPAGASREALLDIANALFVPAQGDAG